MERDKSRVVGREMGNGRTRRGLGLQLLDYKNKELQKKGQPPKWKPLQVLFPFCSEFDWKVNAGGQLSFLVHSLQLSGPQQGEVLQSGSGPPR